MKNKKNNKVLEWFIKEGAIYQEENVYNAPRAFIANSVISWIKKEGPALKQDEIEYIMKRIRLFLLNKADLKWEDGRVEITLPGDNINTKEKTKNQIEGKK